MGVSKVLPLAIGSIAVAGTTAVVTFDIIFSVTLNNTDAPAPSRITAIVASGVGAATIVITAALLGRQIKYRNGGALGNGRQHTHLLAGLGGVFGILSSAASAVVLGLMQNRILDIPKVILGTSTNNLILGGFVVWAVAMLAQSVFIICMIIIQRKELKRAQRYSSAQPHTLSEMQQASRPRQENLQSNHYRGSSSMESKSPPPSSGRSRAGSDTMTSLRSSVSQVVRPITSKTKLINQKTHRPPSLTSSYNEASHPEDGFDSWDTSAVDAQSRQAVEQSSPTPPRFLETIPASPTTSRSPSPGFPLDLEPPRTRRRSRSYSPANSPLPRSYSPSLSFRENPRSRTTSPTESTLEAHIHPLFRTDSPTPPPAATPGTVVTAAPGAGTLISDRASIRRMRSGSLPSSPKVSSPLMHSDSLDSIRRTMLEERTIDEEAESERTITPPIPQWIMEAGNRNSLTGYQTRKISQTRIGEAI